jgi:hypothetical protein
LRSAHDGAFGGEDPGQCVFRGSGPGLGLGEAEVEDLHAIARQHDVLGLDVAVGDTGAVGAVEGVGELRGELQGLIEGDGALLDALGEGFALNQFHHHVALSDVDFRRVSRAL